MTAVVLTLALALAAVSQTGASRVALATVADPRNHPLVDVSADDFVVQEAGATREILSVRPADYPIVLMIDTSAAARDDFEWLRKAATRFLERVGPRPIAIGTVGKPVRVIATFDDDRAAVMTKLAALTPGDEEARPLDAAAVAARTLHDAGALFATIIVLSNSPTERADGVVDDLTAAVIDSNAFLHVVANGVGAPPGGGRNRLLRALAEQTHGQYTSVYLAASFQAALDRLVERLTTELLIEYLVPVGSKPNDVKIGVKIPGARVRGLGVAPR